MKPRLIPLPNAAGPTSQMPVDEVGAKASVASVTRCVLNSLHAHNMLMPRVTVCLVLIVMCCCYDMFCTDYSMAVMSARDYLRCIERRGCVRTTYLFNRLPYMVVLHVKHLCKCPPQLSFNISRVNWQA